MREDPSESFFRLTPGRVLEAVETAGFAPTGHCFPLNALENRVYDVRVDDGSHLVVKFYRPGRWGREAILDEHRMLFALRDAEIPVCAPLRFDGEYLAFKGPAHTLGQHNDEVLSEVLGLSAEEIAELREKKIAGERPSFM